MYEAFINLKCGLSNFGTNANSVSHLEDCGEWKTHRRHNYVKDYKCRHKDYWSNCPIYKQTLKIPAANY